MKRLGFLDQAMFKLEEGGMSPLYMCGAFVLDCADSPFPVDRKTVADHLAACMEEVPLMRQRLVQDPVKVGDLRLVDDPDFDVRNHISYHTLPAPGGYDELTEALGDFSVTRMDLSRPLWHSRVIDGLADGKIAVASHIHHSILDGTGAMKALGSVWSSEPLPGRKPRSKPWPAAAMPGPLQLLGNAVLENMNRLYIQAPRFVWKNTGPILRNVSTQLTKRIHITDRTGGDKDQKPVTVHRTSLNVAPLSASRVVSYLELPLKEVKALHKSFNCSINDLVLLINSYALEHYFATIGEQIDFDIIAGMPVDLRSKDDDSAGNALAFTRVNLHNTVAGIRQRLQAIQEETTAIKRSVKPAKSPDRPGAGIDYKALSTLFSPLALDALVYGIARFNLMDKATVLNVTIANVPGPQVPVYIAGARLHSQIPMGPCADSLALNMTVSSTVDYLVFGYHGCGETIRDKELLVEGARRAFQSLKQAARQRRRPTARRVSPGKRSKSAAKSATRSPSASTKRKKPQSTRKTRS